MDGKKSLRSSDERFVAIRPPGVRGERLGVLRVEAGVHEAEPGEMGADLGPGELAAEEEDDDNDGRGEGLGGDVSCGDGCGGGLTWCIGVR